MNSEIINEVESSLAPSLRFDAFQEIDQDILVDEVVVDLLTMISPSMSIVTTTLMAVKESLYFCRSV